MALQLKRILVGRPRDLTNPDVFHKISLVALLAWVGLGADGLSSSAYGPDEAFRALGNAEYLAVALALATTLTVLIISLAYSQIIKRFPYGGGGYVVATELLGPRFGVISGSALLVDYVLTISVSIASGADQVFSVLPPAWHQWKVLVVALVIGLLVVMNLRGVKESVSLLAPIFGLFLLLHAILIVGGISAHAGAIAARSSAGRSNSAPLKRKGNCCCCRPVTVARLLSAPLDLPLPPESPDPVRQGEAAENHENLFARYVAELQWAVSEAIPWWDALVRRRVERGESEEAAIRANYELRPAGPASRPEVVWVVRSFWLRCAHLNQTLPVDRRVRPEVFLLKWLQSSTQYGVLVAVLSGMPYWPIGLDETGAFC